MVAMLKDMNLKVGSEFETHSGTRFKVLKIYKNKYNLIEVVNIETGELCKISLNAVFLFLNVKKC